MAALLLSLLVIQICRVLSFSAKKSPVPPIVACQSTGEVQAAISLFLRPNDVVLELGAQLSDTSTHLCRTIGPGGKAILVDVQRKEATSGRSTQRNSKPFLGDDSNRPSNIENESKEDEQDTFRDRVDYQELEQFDQWRNLYKGDNHFDVIILDIGSMIGNDLYLTTLSIATEFLASQNVSPRAILVKSKELYSLARRITHSQRLMDGTTTLPANLCRSTEPIIIPCVGVNDYRKTIPFVVSGGDDVLEVGCHFGTTTALLYEVVKSNPITGDNSSGFCAGVDIGEKIIASAKMKYDGPVFEVMNAWNTLDLLKIKAKHGSMLNDPTSMMGYDVVYADIGGLSGAHGLLESLALLDAISKALEPRCIVIKSQCMKRLASQLVPFSRVKNKA
ncbi:unnamed protein product [Cylindrotheca closterium]|uniref:Methyltransferase domain-containing protein n=1 Tax=Cylindrotheca closterium TaxID=2856 RepID=A0AAD2JP94_9STRA|nr:unnamed protein product [Cylindrotheca closterium]